MGFRGLLFLIFLSVPLIEIYLLIEIGGLIGAPATVFLVVFTAVLGALLLTSPTDLGPGIFVAASLWAFVGGIMLFGEALRLRAQHRRQADPE